jgi:ABC-2 type transport system ATP-binding protein
MRNGKIIHEGSPRQLRDRLRGRVLELSGNPTDLLVQVADVDPDVQDVQRFGNSLHLKVAPGQSKAVQTRLAKRIPASGGHVERVEEITPLLEDVFIDLTRTVSSATEIEAIERER